MFNAWLQYKERSWMFTIKADNNKAMSNVRIPAYERLVIKEAYIRVTPVSNGMDLSREIFKLEAAVGNAKIRKAIEAIKSEL